METRIRAHVFANLFAHEAGIAIRGKGVEKHPEQFPRTHLRQEELHRQFANRREVAYKGKARPDREDDPNDVLVPFLNQLLHGELAVIQTNAGRAVTLDLAFDPQENFAVHRLRTSVTAPQTSSYGGEQK